MDSAKALRDAYSQWVEQWAAKLGIPAEMARSPFAGGFLAGMKHAVALVDTCDQEPSP